MQSLNNQSNSPLRAEAIYIGSWDDILQYQNIQINLQATTNCQIIYYESNDKVLVNQTAYSYSAGNVYFNSLTSTSRYVYFTVRNLEATNQTQFNFSILYKQSPASTSTIGSDVNIISPVDGDGYVEVSVQNVVDISGTVTTDISGQTVDISGQSVVVSGSVNVDNFPASQVVSGSVNVDNFPASQVISGSVNVDNFPASQVISGSVNVDNFPASQVISGSVNVDNFPTTQAISNDDIGTIASSLNNQRKNVVAWNNVSVVQNGVSNAINPGTSTYCNTTLSCYGTSSQNATIAVQFSQDNITYYTTQYQYTVTAGDFGFSIACSAYNIRLILLSATTSAISAFIDIC